MVRPSGTRVRGRPRLSPLDWIALALCAAGLLCTVTGLLPGHVAAATVRRIVPILAFLVTIVVLAELTAQAGVFDALARAMAIAARGRFAALFALCVAFAAATTIGLNLDTTAVLLTPVMLALARTLSVPALPLAMTTVWLANTASLLLPVSNLTNLLAAGRVGLSPLSFAAATGAAQAAALAVTAALLWLFYWRRGRREALRYAVPPPYQAPDRWLARICGAACVLFIAALLSGVELAVASAIAMCVALASFAIRRRSALAWSLIPWRLPAFVAGLFLVVQTLSDHVLGRLTSALMSASPGPAGAFRAAGTGAVLGNLVNNLPAYVAGEAVIPAANHVQLLALLTGVNIASLITPWASLATLLWYERCRSAGVAVPLRRYVLTSACLALAGAGASVAALLWA